MKKRKQADVLRELLENSGRSQRGTARELQIAERTMRYYVSGEQPIPRSVMIALETLTEDKGFYQTLAAEIRRKAGCTCGDFNIESYEGVSGGPRALAGFSVGSCQACADGISENVAYTVLNINRIPVIDGRRDNKKPKK